MLGLCKNNIIIKFFSRHNFRASRICLGHDIIWCIKNTSIKNYISSDISQSALEYQSKNIFKDIIENNKARIIQNFKVELAKLFSEKGLKKNQNNFCKRKFTI